MSFFVIGQGNVGSALSNFLKNRNVEHKILHEPPENAGGILFLAVSDSALKPLIEDTLRKNSGLYVVHFSAATKFEDERVFLLHPFSSINKKSDFSQILFTLWGGKNRTFEEVLEKTGLKFVFCGKNPDLLYHASAVMSGNFTQFFALNALRLLEESGFSKAVSEKLIRQLVSSSLDNVFRDGIKGITGPASRGETEILLNEYNALQKENLETAVLFKAVNDAIFKLFTHSNRDK